ncbi:MAG: YeeE/YedE family protein [Hyphomicrobiaceae bacterium]|nr:YeeE/YedE family protein [Hyphomicrobiaceae bacterium]
MIETLRETMTAEPQASLAIGGLLIGALFGALVQRTNFCTMGSVSDIVNFGDWRRFRAWLLACAVAITGTQVLAFAGVVPLEKSMYLGASLNWLGHILGGLMLGFGMVFAGGCPSKTVARVGGGDLRSLVTLMVIGIAGFMAGGGVLGPSRAALEAATRVDLAGIAPSQGLGDILAAQTGITRASAGLGAGVAIAVLIALYVFASRAFRSSPVHVLSGIGIGLLIIAGWAVTGLAYDELADTPTNPISLTFVRPAGDTLDWLQRFTALGWPGFGVTTVFGAIFGAFVAATAAGQFRLATFSDPADMVRNLMGAVLMGVGGMLALGCTVGQGITGVSTLAVGSFLTFAGIVAGGVLGLKAFERMLLAEA